jgi:hypothetical protein
VIFFSLKNSLLRFMHSFVQLLTLFIISHQIICTKQCSSGRESLHSSTWGLVPSTRTSAVDNPMVSLTIDGGSEHQTNKSNDDDEYGVQC